MKKSFTTKTKLFVTILLALTMVFSLASSVACKKGGNPSSDDSSSSITVRTDTQLLKNGDFEYYSENATYSMYPVYSTINWTKGNDSQNGSNSVSSSNSSGIIDTRVYQYEYDEKGFIALDDEGKPIFSKNDKGEKIETYQNILKAKDSQFEKFKIYEYEKNEDGSFKLDDLGNKIKAKDENGKEIYTFYNPHSPSYYGLTTYTREDGALTGGGKVLMLNNHSTNDKGAAQYFKSSSEITLQPNENGRFEVWVLTKDISSKLGQESLKEIGAYVELTTTIGTITTPATRIKNINTDGEWVKFSIYVKGSNYAQTKIGIKLGLGLGSKNIYQEYAEGYAFFDDASFKVLDKEEALPTSYDLGNVKMYDGELEQNKLIVNGNKDFVNFLFADYTNSIIENPISDDNKDYKYLYSENFTTAQFTNITLGIDCSKEESAFDISGGTTENFEILNNYINFNNLSAQEKALFDTTAVPTIDNGVLTFSSDKYFNATYTTPDFDVDGVAANTDPDKDNYLKISFWVKTNLEASNNGLTILLLDKGTGSVTPAEVKLKINGSENGNYSTTKGINKDYDDFIKVTVVVSNTYRLNKESEVLARKFALKFVLGPTAPVNANNIYAFPKGEVWVKDFTLSYFEESEVNSIEKTNDKSVTERKLQADLANTTEPTETNTTYSFSYGAMVDNIDKNVVAGIQNYTGVPGNHIRTLGGTESSDYEKQTAFVQENTVNGLFNTEYFANYDNDDFSGIKSEIETWAKNAQTKNPYIQPLMINNKVDGLSYGYIGESNTIAIETTYTISIKVKIFGDATAYIYLTDATDKKEFKVLTVSAENTDLSQSINEDYSLAITKDMADTITGGIGYAEIKFIIKTGSSKTINYRLELWNGPRTFTTGSNTNKAGIVLFDDVTTSTTSNYDESLLKLESMYDKDLENVATDYSFDTADSNKKEFTRLPSKVLTDENPDEGETRTYTVDDKENTKTAYMSNGFFIITDLSSIDAPTVVDERTTNNTTDEDTEEDSAEDSTSKASIWLLVSSVIVALALIVALIGIVVKKIVNAVYKRKLNKHSYYNRDSRDKAMANISKKKETQAKKEYDYENIDNNLEDEEDIEVEQEQEELAEVEEISEEIEESEESNETETSETTEDDTPSQE